MFCLWCQVKNFVPCPRSQRFFFSPKIFYCTFPKFSSFMLKLMIHFEFCVNCETLGFPSLLPPSPTLPLPYPRMSNCCCSHSFVTPWIIALQASLSMGFFLQEHWSGLPCPPPGTFPTRAWTHSLQLLHCQADSLPLHHLGSPGMSNCTSTIGWKGCLSFLHQDAFTHLSKITWTHLCGSLSGFSVLFCWSGRLFPPPTPPTWLP